MIDSIAGFLTGDPPTGARIDQARKALAAKKRARHDRAATVTMLVPIPGLDMLAGLATAAAGEAMADDERALEAALAWDEGALERDWSATDTTADYAAKVRAMGRPMIRAETVALERHIESVESVKTAGAAVANAARDVFKSLLDDVFGKSTPKKG